MSEGWTTAERREMFRRLQYVLEQHPMLSGMMTDDHKHWLRELADRGLRRERQPETGEEPDYEIELGYDEIEEDDPLPDYPKPLSEAVPQADRSPSMTDDTRKPVEEMSGRELDAAVAEEVFGAEVAWREHAGREHPYADRTLWSKWCPTCGYDGHWDARSVPEFATDIAAALVVMDEIVAPGFELIRLPDNSGFKAAFHGVENYIYAHADTAPEAICRAVLKAVRSDA